MKVCTYFGLSLPGFVLLMILSGAVGSDGIIDGLFNVIRIGASSLQDSTETIQTPTSMYSELSSLMTLEDKGELCRCSKSQWRDLLCASDWVTYKSACEMRCARQKNPRLKLLYPGPCIPILKGTTIDQNDICNNIPDEEYLVCGSDRQTYLNPVALQCIRSEDDKSDLKIAHIGACSLDDVPLVKIPPRLRK